MDDMVYLSFDQVLAVHKEEIEVWGGSQGLRDLGLLESALARPQVSFGGEDLYQTIFLKAAALMHLLILNHAFVDGNKRTGMVATAGFLYLNGWVLKLERGELLSAALKVESKQWGIEEIAEWLEKSVKKL